MSTEDIDEIYNNTLAVLKNIEKHPYWSSLKLLQPDLLSYLFDNTYERHVFALAKQLCLMGLENKITEMRALLSGINSSNKEESLHNVLENLYVLFGELSENLSDEYTHSLDKLFEMIHQFARDIESGFQLYNLENLTIQLNKAKNTDTENLEHQTSIDNSLRVLRILRNNNPNRKYAYLLEEEVRELDSDSTENQSNRTYKYITNYKKDPIESKEDIKKRERAEFILNGVSFAVSVILGIGEGLVGTVFMLSTLHLLPAILLIGIPAAICNYYLFRSESFQILKSMYSGRIWKKPNGEALSRQETAFVVGSLSFSFSAAASFGFLSMGSAIKGFTLLFGLLGVSTGPIGILAIATVIATVSTIGLFTLFAYMTVNWVRDSGPEKLKDKIKGLPLELKEFLTHKEWNTLSNGQKAEHVARTAISALFNTAFFALAVAAVIVVNVATTGLFKHKSVEIFKTLFHVGAKLANMLSYIIVVGLGAVVNALFYARATVNLVKVIRDLTLSIAHPVRTLNRLSASWNAIKDSPIRILDMIIKNCKRLFLFSCVASNTIGQMSGPRFDATSTRWGNTVYPVNRQDVPQVNAGSMIFGSGGANFKASREATRRAPTVTEHSDELASVAIGGPMTFFHSAANGDTQTANDDFTDQESRTMLSLGSA